MPVYGTCNVCGNETCNHFCATCEIAGVRTEIEEKITNAVGEERDRILSEIEKIKKSTTWSDVNYNDGWREACDRIRDAVR